LGVALIIKIAIPALMLIYPITIVLILLNLLKDSFASEAVFRAVVLVTFIFSIPDFLVFVLPDYGIQKILNFVPLANYNLGWLLPAILTFSAVNIYNIYVFKKVV